MSLKTNYKNDMFAGKRKYQVTENDDGTISLDDVTVYQQQGDVYSADDINSTNKDVNKNTEKTAALDAKIDQETAALDAKISGNHSKTLKSVNVTFPASGWSASAPYTQAVNVSGMKETDAPTPGIIYPSNVTESQKASIDKSSNMITQLETKNGYLLATCKFKKPTVDIIIGLQGGWT